MMMKAPDPHSLPGRPGAPPPADPAEADTQRTGALLALRDLLYRVRDFEGVLPQDMGHLVHVIASHRPGAG